MQLHETFTALFPVILTDRGSEFTDPLAIEFKKDGERRTRVFSCDLQRSDQKGGIEVAHEFIHRVLSRGTSFDPLTQADVVLMMSQIDAYKGKKRGNRPADQLLRFLHAEGTLQSLGVSEIPSDQIKLTAVLLNKCAILPE